MAKSITDKTPTDSAGWTGSTVIQYRAVYSWWCQTDIYRHGYWLTAIHWGNCSLKLWEKLVVKKEYLSNLKIWSSVFGPLMWTDVNWAENDATKWIPNGFTCGLCHREQMSEWIAASLNSSVFTESSLISSLALRVSSLVTTHGSADSALSHSAEQIQTLLKRKTEKIGCDERGSWVSAYEHCFYIWMCRKKQTTSYKVSDSLTML